MKCTITTPIGTKVKMVNCLEAEKYGHIKIGYTGSSDISKRMKSIQGSCPEKIKILYVIPGCTFQDEHYLHMKYRAFNVHGEWYENPIRKLLDNDIKALEANSAACQKLPTGSDHYLYLVEA
jgi:hypothetical protein